MAKVQNPVIGRTKGSAGGMTFAKVYDKNVMKAKVFEVNNPNTASQQVQRSYFREVSALSAVFTPDMLRTLFPQRPKGISRRNGIFKQLAEFSEVVAGVKSPKLSELETLGNAPTMDFGTTSCAIDGSNVNVGLDASVKANTNVNENYFVAILVNDTQNLISLDTTNALVSVGTLAIPLPAGWETTDTVHAIPLILNDKEGKISTVGFGTMGVNERPARKR